MPAGRSAPRAAVTGAGPPMASVRVDTSENVPTAAGSRPPAAAAAPGTVRRPRCGRPATRPPCHAVGPGTTGQAGVRPTAPSAAPGHGPRAAHGRRRSGRLPQPASRPVMLSMPHRWRGRNRTMGRASDGGCVPPRDGRHRPSAGGPPGLRHLKCWSVPGDRATGGATTGAGAATPCQLCGNLQWRPLGTLRIMLSISRRKGTPGPRGGAQGGRAYRGPPATRTVLTRTRLPTVPTHPERRGGGTDFSATGPSPAEVGGTDDRWAGPSCARAGRGRMPAPPRAGRRPSGSRVELLDSGHAH